MTSWPRSGQPDRCGAMLKDNVVLTCGGKWVGLVVQFRAAMRQTHTLQGGKLLVADCAPFTPAGCFADGALTVPPARHPEFVETLLRLCEQHAVRVVVPHTSLDMHHLAAHVERFAEHGITLVCPPPELLELCYDKLQFAAFAHEEGLCQPRTYPAEMLGDAPLPLFAKRRRGYGSIGAGLCRTLAEAQPALARFPDLVFQEFIAAPELTVDAFINSAGRCNVRVPRIRDKIVDGESVQAHTVRDAGICALVDQTIAALARRGLRGPLNVQVFAGARPLLIEVNARVGSGSVLGDAATWGRYFTSILRDACGEQVDGDPDDYQEGLALYRYLGDVFHVGTRQVVFPQ